MRTDRTRVCIPCGLRFSTVACPRCREPALHDLKRPGAVDVLFASMRKHAARSSPRARRAHSLSILLDWLNRRSQTLIVFISLLMGISGVWLLAREVSFLAPKLFFLFFAVSWAVLSILGAAARTVLEMWRDSLVQHLALQLALAPDPAIDPTLQRTSVRGRVHVTEPVLSPFSGVACAAFRLLGAGPNGPIDDGAGGAFEVRLDVAGPVRVDARRATLALERFGKRVTLNPNAPLADFLRARAALVTPGPVHVEEALLREGDEVVIEGTCDELAEALNYRDTTTVRAFKEIDGSPLMVRGV